MALLVSGTHVTYSFTDPVEDPERLENRAGLFLILELRAEVYHLLDLGEAEHVQTSILTHPRLASWRWQFHGRLAFSAAYPAGASGAVRRAILDDIRSRNVPRFQP